MKKPAATKPVKAPQNRRPQPAKTPNAKSGRKPAAKANPGKARKNAVSSVAAKSAAKKSGVKKKANAARAGRSKLSAANIDELFARFAADTPEPKGELEYTNPYTLLVAVALSAQATDVGVNKATRGLFKLADTPEKMLRLGEEALREHIKTIGLFRNKAKNVIALSKMLVEDYGAQVPRDREALERLPGVGRKTANVVLNIAFGKPTIAVDTHLFRIGNRTGLAPGKDPLAVELCLLKVIPGNYLLHAHHWLILHGRYVCIARKPKCPVCIIRELCKFKDKTELL